jgi:electron transfer flavoprotein alpha subunit
MSVLIFIDQAEGHVKKASLEAMSYGADLAARMGTSAEGIWLGTAAEDLSALGQYGISKVYQVNNSVLNSFDAQLYSRTMAAAVEKTGASVIVFSHNIDGKALAPRLAARLKAGLVAGAVDLPDTSAGFVVKKTVFSGKAYAHVSVQSDIKIISVIPNAYHINKSDATATVEELAVEPGSPKIKVTAVEKLSDEIPLSEAEIVVSGGRGLKGPENWGMIEELAKLLGAATACSRPVADANWRPHHEHVGQTGLAIAPNLYFAVGISGAIQHLAGVNRSKVIVVINKDPEAPFFKAADYGIVGDAFEVMPKIIEAVKALKLGS